MRKLLAFLVGALYAATVFADGEVFLAPINTAYTINFTLLDAAGLLDVNEADTGTESSVSCDTAAEATASADFVDRGSRYSLALTQAEMNCAIVSVFIAGEIVNHFTIQTYGTGSNITALPAAAPGAAGGLLQAGTNADFDVTANSTFSGGLTITQSTSNTSALVVTGNGTGNGATFTSGSGATGNGASFVAASTNGNGTNSTGTGTGGGSRSVGGATGGGVVGIGGSTSGNGLFFASQAGNSYGASIAGQGSGGGLQITPGATGIGLDVTGGSTSGAAGRFAAVGSGDGLVLAGATNGDGLDAAGAGTGSGALLTGGATGDGLEGIGGSTSGAGSRFAGTAGNSPGGTFVGQGSAAGVLHTGGATGEGQRNVGGATSGPGMANVGSAGNSAGQANTGQGSAAGAIYTAGATGVAAQYTGGSTSGNAFGTTITAPLGPVQQTGILESGTLQSATATTAVLRTATAFADDFLNCSFIEIIQGTGVGQRKTIDDWTSTGDTATVTTWTTTPDNTSDYIIWGSPCAGASTGDNADVLAVLGTPAGASMSADLAAIEAQTDDIGAAGAGLTAADDAVITAVAGVQSDTDNIQTRIPAALVNSRMDSTIDDTGFETGAETDVGTAAMAQLVALELDQLLSTTYNPAAEPAADSLFGDLTESDGGVTRFNANALEQAPSGTGASAVAIADEVQTRTIAGVTLVATTTNLTNAAGAGDLTATMKTSVQTAAAAAINADTGDTFTAIPTIGTVTNLTNAPTAGDLTATMKTSVQTAAAAAINADTGDTFTAIPAGPADDPTLAAIAALNNLSSAQVKTAVGIISGTCSAGSTTACTDAALTQADSTQLAGRLACFSDSWCGLIGSFTVGTDTLNFTKVAPSTRNAKTFDIYPATVE